MANALGLNSLRIDKWLWAARFFKTRSLASEACESGRVECNGVRAKASREVRLGDTLKVRNEGGEYVLEVLMLSEMRGSGAVAAGYFKESAESVAGRAQVVAERKAMLDAGGLPMGRPSRKDRDATAKLRGRIVRF